MPLELLVQDGRHPGRDESPLDLVQVLDQERGVSLRAGVNGSSTPRWISTCPERNQQPPRAARFGGLGTCSKPRISP